MKRRNSVFNNYNTSKYSSSSKKKGTGLLNTQNEFAREFFGDKTEEECEEVRKKNKLENEYKGKKNQSKS